MASGHLDLCSAWTFEFRGAVHAAVAVAVIYVMRVCVYGRMYAFVCMYL